MIEEYVTAAAAGSAEITEKKSRFIAYVRPVTEESQALDFIGEIRKKHWDARHNVYAYRIGENSSVQRYSDDGEPSGTAGMPVLDVLRGRDIHDTAIVVTRYFGGILLGTGGLVRAYGRAAQEGLSAAGIVKKQLCDEVVITCDYNLSGRVQYEALQCGNIIESTEYTNNVIFRILCKKSETDNFIKQINNATAAKIKIDRGPERYININI